MNKMNIFTACRTPRFRLKTRYAFTLIEILVCISIVSLVALAVYSIFSNGLNAWRRGSENKTYERTIRLASEKMTRELRNVFEFSLIPFEGTEDSVIFPALISSKLDAEGDYREEYYEVGRIAYFYDESKDAFCKEVKSLSEVLNDEELGSGKSLIENVSALEMGYCYLDNATGTYEWKSDWKKEEQDSIPQALRMEILFKKGASKSNNFTRIIFIPMGTGEQKIELGSVTQEIEEED